MTRRFDALIVGSGHGGAQTAIGLRQAGFQGAIGMIGEEPDPPYERPPLSKEYLSGAKSFERILIRPENFWQERKIERLPARRVVRIDQRAHRALDDTGESYDYGTMIWAAGGHARRLACEGHDLGGVHTIRRRADVDRLIAELSSTEDVAIVGGGYIGLEAAAVLVGLGKAVTVFEVEPRVLGRVAGEPLSRFYEAEHRSCGVTLRLNTAVDRILGADGRVTGVCLSDGSIQKADMVIVGIGIIPSVAPLLEAGAVGGNGVEVDRSCRTSLPDIFAIGDCARRQNPYAAGASIRLESVQNAADMAAAVAATMMGHAVAEEAPPWFWSNQYDLRLQTVGLSGGYDEAVVRGRPETRRFSIVYLKRGRVIALDCVNAVKDYVQGRALVQSGARLAPDLLADAKVSLKDIPPAKKL